MSSYEESYEHTTTSGRVCSQNSVLLATHTCLLLIHVTNTALPQRIPSPKSLTPHTGSACTHAARPVSEVSVRDASPTSAGLRFISNYVALDGKFSSSAGMTTYLPTRPGRGVGPPTTYLPRGGDIQVGGRPIVGSAMVPEQLPDLGSSQPCALRTPSLGLRRLAWWLSCM